MRKLIEALTPLELDESLDNFPAVRNQFTDGQAQYLRTKIILDYFEKHEEEIDKLLEAIKKFNLTAYNNYATKQPEGAKQTAQEGLFSQVLEEFIEDCRATGLKGGYIHPSDLVEELLCILKNNLESSLFFINSFLLTSKFIEEFVLDELDLREKLKNLSLKPVSDGICPLIACSEWCRLKFLEQETLNVSLAQEIEEWQNQIIKYKKEVNLDKIKQFISNRSSDFKLKIEPEDLRIQIEIEPEIDNNKNTGLPTGLFFLNMNLWIKSQKLPFGRFAENVVLKLQGIEESAVGEKSDNLRICLENEDFLSGLIRKARYSLTESVKPTIEIFLPLVFYQESLEKISFKYGRTKKELGKEYQIFINSFERYFDEDFREIRDEIYEKKKELWSNNNNLDSEICYIGMEPSKNDLEMIEEAKAIAVWSRNDQKPLVEGDEGHIKISEWKNWPEKIHNLRKQHNDLEITLFWDDLYPKPSRRCRPLNTKVVE
ncbi:MAG: hypothetical protein AB3A66_28535 (plasmid) [Nodularia sp. CChRGM 3473]